MQLHESKQVKGPGTPVVTHICGYSGTSISRVAGSVDHVSTHQHILELVYFVHAPVVLIYCISCIVIMIRLG